MRLRVVAQLSLSLSGFYFSCSSPEVPSQALPCVRPARKDSIDTVCLTVYIQIYIIWRWLAETAKLFANGRSQAVRLPKEYAFSGDEVYIKKIDGVVLLIPKSDPWKPFFDSLSKFSNDFMENGREQGTLETRESLS
jgi:antitoxin VapB